MSIFEQVFWIQPFVIFFAVLIGILLVFLTFIAWAKRDHKNQKEMIQHFEFPPQVFVGVKERYSHLTDDDVNLALDQLRLYFLLCWMGDNEELAMPSRLVDTCWHCFILQTRNYQTFCKQAFGGYLHHVPQGWVPGSQASANAAVNEPQKINLKEGAKVFQAALAMTDMVSRASKTAASSLRVPMLFAIDKMLKIPDGNLYTDEAVQLLGTFDWRTSRLSDGGSQSSSEGSSASLGCGDGTVACGNCAGGH
ncbi:MAG: hypothetical protein Q7K13_08295 [Polynucleobacter sp.]|uniref:glycine-rich domain-containing protein n=1 Tax=Polynucleobacter sp. TaxID=2029855 RepID=UPI002728A4B4|nr:hypothetical protein [Polynucleobacter sp.]MDO8714461.1 hypothetical protein [Polynucleobacter sp.]